LGNHWAILHSNHFSNQVDGNFGVRLFFGISGFLITFLLVQEEQQTGTISLKNFYIRRALKIWPIYFLFILVCFFLQSRSFIQFNGENWRGLLTFTRNFYNERTGYDSDWISSHLWSLSVEEQFYLVWPVLFCLFKRTRCFLLGAAILISIIFRTIELFGVSRLHVAYLFQPQNTLNYLDCLGWGCLAALFYNKKLFENYSDFGKTIHFIIGSGLLIVPYFVGIGKGLQAFGFIYLLLQSVRFHNWGVYKILNLYIVKKIGIFSYSIYVWQQMVVWAWPHELTWLLWPAISILVGYFSYQYIEKPSLGLKKNFYAGKGPPAVVIPSENPLKSTAN
jgi:peptidoglycan/LPS O-acetylase OafA/YrhL